MVRPASTRCIGLIFSPCVYAYSFMHFSVRSLKGLESENAAGSIFAVLRILLIRIMGVDGITVHVR
jgi:hypothetical protein